MNLRRMIFFLLIPVFFICLSQIKVPWKFSEKWLAVGIESESPHFECENFSQILSKPLRYLGHGMQAIAFESDDRKYVLKFLTIQPIKGRKIASYFIGSKKLPSPKHENKVKRVMQMYVRVFREMKEEMGLIALHFQPTETRLGYCEVIDREGDCFQIDLDQTPFVLQYRGELLASVLSDKNNEKYQRLYKLFEDFLESRARKGYTDPNKAFKPENYAFINSQPAMIDPGNLVYSESQKINPEPEIQRVLSLFHRQFSYRSHHEK